MKRIFGVVAVVATGSTLLAERPLDDWSRVADLREGAIVQIKLDHVNQHTSKTPVRVCRVLPAAHPDSLRCDVVTDSREWIAEYDRAQIAEVRSAEIEERHSRRGALIGAGLLGSFMAILAGKDEGFEAAAVYGTEGVVIGAVGGWYSDGTTLKVRAGALIYSAPLQRNARVGGKSGA